MTKPLSQVGVDKKDLKTEKYKDKELQLESLAVNPFDQWSDWYTENGEAVITITSMQNKLYNEWERQTRQTNTAENNTALKNGLPQNRYDHVRIHNHEKFQNNFKGPGAYLDSTHYDDPEKVDESYTIITARTTIHRKACEKWIQRLNQKYGRNFKIKDEDYLERQIKHKTDKVNKKTDIEKEKIKEIFKILHT